MLNSRTLCPLSNFPDNLQGLTPGHFFIGASLLALSDYNLIYLSSNRLSRWLYVQQMVKRLWKCWYHDYLHKLQQRNKWKDVQPNTTIGDVVHLKEDYLPHLVWKRQLLVTSIRKELG